MHTVSTATKTRAAARRRVGPWRAKRLRAMRSQLGLENPLGLAGLGLALGLVLAAALFHPQFAPFTLRLTGVLGSGKPQRTTFLDAGEIVFTPLYGNDCRTVLFSNRTGRFGPDRHVHCDTGMTTQGEIAARDAPVSPDAAAAERLNSIRQAFTTRAAR